MLRGAIRFLIKMGKLTYLLKWRWEESRIAIGYFLWIGVFIINWIYNFWDNSFAWYELWTFHFIGLFLVAKYHWFSPKP